LLGPLAFLGEEAGLPALVLVLVWVVLGCAGVPELACCLRLSTTRGASAAGVGALSVLVGAGAPVVCVLGAVLVGVVLGAGVVSVVVVVVSLEVVVGAGVVVVVPVVCWPPSASVGAPVSAELVVVVPLLGWTLPPSAGLASGPPRPAAVSPPPASADRIARTARWRARLSVGIRESRSSRGTSHVGGWRNMPTGAGYAHRDSYRQPTTNP
jgi:hypothetical protein